MSVNAKNAIKKVQQAEFDALYKTAHDYKSRKDYVKAIEIYHKMISKIDQKVQCLDCAKLYEDIGDIYFDLKDFQHAFTNFQKASEIYAENDNIDLRLNQLKKIGTLQQGIYQFRKAIDIFHQGLSISTRLNLKDKIIEFELLLGNAYNWADELDTAEKYLVSAIKKEKKNRNPLVELRSHVSYAILLRKMKKYMASEKHFKYGMQQSRRNDNIYLTDITRSYGILQLEIGDYEEAERLLLESEKNALDEDNMAKKIVVCEYLSKLYSETKQFEKAYHYNCQFYDMKLQLIEKGFSEDNNNMQIKMGLEDAKRERMVAEETAKAKSLFIATISHEIRTPMNIILGTTSLMLNDKPKKEHVRYLHTLKKSGENLLGIINDVLDVSKIEAGRLEIEYEPVDIREIFDNVMTVLEQSAKDKGLDLSYEVEDAIGPYITSDPLRITQIMTNLVNNAIKFTATGSIRFEAKLKEKDILQLSVIDTGIGIPKDKLSGVFEQYEQVRNNIQKKYKGTGLGLAISKKLVEMMHGTIAVKSKVNQGTCFTVTLPYEEAVQEKEDSILLAQRNSKFLKNKTILVVDDVEDNRYVIKETLLFFQKQMHILEAVNGREALAEIKKQDRIDLVIMDLDMPEMNGFEALNKIRKNKEIKHLKIMASTASVIANDDKELLEYGFDAYLPKPFHIDQFYQLLEKMLQ